MWILPVVHAVYDGMAVGLSNRLNKKHSIYVRDDEPSSQLMPTDFVQLTLSSQLLVKSTGHVSNTFYPVIRRIGCEHCFHVFQVLEKPTSTIRINDSSDDIPRRKITVSKFGGIVLAMRIDNFLTLRTSPLYADTSPRGQPSCRLAKNRLLQT